MNKNYFVFAGIFVGVCVILCAGIWFSLGELYALREEYDQLSSGNVNNSGIISNLESRNNSLSRIASLHINSSQTVPDAIAFFALVRQTMENNNIALLNMTASGQNDSGKRDNILQLKFHGNYYAMARMLADWRNLPVPSKITRLDLKRNHTLPEELVEVDVTLQVMTEE